MPTDKIRQFKKSFKQSQALGKQDPTLQPTVSPAKNNKRYLDLPSKGTKKRKLENVISKDPEAVLADVQRLHSKTSCLPRSQALEADSPLRTKSQEFRATQQAKCLPLQKHGMFENGKFSKIFSSDRSLAFVEEFPVTPNCYNPYSTFTEKSKTASELERPLTQSSEWIIQECAVVEVSDTLVWDLLLSK